MNSNSVEGLSEEDILNLYDNIIDTSELARCVCHTKVWSSICKCRDVSGFAFCWNHQVNNSSRCIYYCTTTCGSSSCYSDTDSSFAKVNFCSSI